MVLGVDKVVKFFTW